MSLSLYGRLFKYRPSEARSPKEDFLTEGLCDLLNRLDEQGLWQFVRVLTGKGPPASWETAVKASAHYGWNTQRTIKNVGRFDLVLEVDSYVLLAVEVKQNAHFQNSPKGEQLELYGKWLSGQFEEAGLAVLTHLTPPPDDFDTRGGPSTKYAVLHRSVCWWPAIWRWLKSYEHKSRGPQRSWSALAAEFATFLEENEMDNETIDFRDVAASEVFLTSSGKFTQTFSLIASKLRTLIQPLLLVGTKPRLDNFTYDGASGGVIGDMVKLGGSFGGTYLQWGIFYPSANGSWWTNTEPALPHSAFAFVFVGETEEGTKEFVGITRRISKLAAWTIIAETVEGERLEYPMAYTPVSQFSRKNEELGSAIARWLEEAVSDLRNIAAGGRKASS